MYTLYNNANRLEIDRYKEVGFNGEWSHVVVVIQQ